MHSKKSRRKPLTFLKNFLQCPSTSCPGGGMVDTGDSKSPVPADVRVQVPPWAPQKQLNQIFLTLSSEKNAIKKMISLLIHNKKKGGAKVSKKQCIYALFLVYTLPKAIAILKQECSKPRVIMHFYLKHKNETYHHFSQSYFHLNYSGQSLFSR